jgi:hypothetical protein
METLVSHRLQTMLCGIALCAATFSIAEAEGENEEVPDMAFLEYLGMWEESYEDWLNFDKEAVAENDKRRGLVPEGEESTEKDDES